MGGCAGKGGGGGPSAFHVSEAPSIRRIWVSMADKILAANINLRVSFVCSCFPRVRSELSL